MNDEPADLDATLDCVWTSLLTALHDRDHPFRYPAAATVSAGAPDIRTVVLRATDRDRQVLEFYTDSRSAKITALRGNPQIALHIWDPGQRFQVRIAARVELLTADTARWAALTEKARLAYGGQPAPGAVIEDPCSCELRPDLAHFVTVICHISMIETLRLSEPHHQRARFRRDDDWKGVWLAP